jgi:Bbp16-like protein
MIIDGALQFTGTPGAVNVDTPTTGTQQSTNVIDLVNARDMGIGDDPALKLLCVVRAAFTAGTSIQVQFQGAPDAGGGTPGTYTTYAESAAVLEADAIAGRYLLPMDIPRPPPGVAMPRFYRLQYVTAGTHSTGTIYAALVLDRQDNPAYPAGITVPN